MSSLSPAQNALIDSIVASYVTRKELAERLSDNLSTLFHSDRLAPLVHSIKARAKDPDSLKDKLQRKMKESLDNKEMFHVTPENLFETINDLAGVRLLHLHTTQFEVINRVVLELLSEEAYKVTEGPIARVWDDEYKAVFNKMDVQTVESKRMYTSVHYVIETGAKTNKRTAEIQVRTLAEELWGEVDHTINYPHQCEVPSCVEQIKVLARLTSSCTRLVDSIFFSRDNEKK